MCRCTSLTASTAPRSGRADDFVILSRGRAAEALAWTKAVMTKLGLLMLVRNEIDRFFDLAMSEAFGIELESDDRDGMLLS
jgi:hypothetical protein